ncbi:MAG: DUF4442 domain-containing protein [Bdellovibrionales bacterium]
MTSKTKYHYLVKALSFFKVPLLFSTSPSVVEFSDTVSTVYLPLKRKNKNHVGSMYFGALAMGAELSVALMAIKGTQESKHKVSFIFKDFTAQFLKRADKGVYFTCEEADEAMKLVKLAEESSERVEKTLNGYAYIDVKTKEPIFTYTLTLSLKKH